MKLRQIIVLALLSTTCFAAAKASEANREAYPEFAAKMDQYGYAWEAHPVKTDDGWHLTIFRMLGKTGQPTNAELHPERYPLLIQHGALESALGWVNRDFLGPTIPLQFVELGYDVWLGNSRGVQYSEKHDRDGEWTQKERWEFTWADMGRYDIPAVVETILKVSKAAKLSIMAHSQGTSQIWYALATNQDFYAERVNRYVALSSCLVPEFNEILDYERAVSLFLWMEEKGNYNIFGGDESSINYRTFTCMTEASGGECIDNGNKQMFPIEGILFRGYAESIASYRYYAQLSVERRFQEPISMADWAGGQRISPLVDLSKIDRVPVSILHPINDYRCEVELNAEWAFNQVKTPDKHLRFEDIIHYTFIYYGGWSFMQRLAETVEVGTAGSSQIAIIGSFLAITSLS